MASRSDRTAGVEAGGIARPFLRWLGRACRQAREERGVGFEHEPVLDRESQERIRAALERLKI
jgi:hypothetical protein